MRFMSLVSWVQGKIGLGYSTNEFCDGEKEDYDVGVVRTQLDSRLAFDGDDAGV